MLPRDHRAFPCTLYRLRVREGRDDSNVTLQEVSVLPVHLESNEKEDSHLIIRD